MEELNDYSGEWRPNVNFEDFSKDALVRLLKAYQRAFVGLSGGYHSVNSERMSVEETWKLDTEAYLRQLKSFEFPLVAKAMNIQGNDVLTLLKIFQVVPDGAREGYYECQWDVKNNNHAILTFTKCPTLFLYEKHGQEKDIECLCGPRGMEDLAFEAYCELVNPNMKCRALKRPPRKSPDEICCQWEFKLE